MIKAYIPEHGTYITYHCTADEFRLVKSYTWDLSFANYFVEVVQIYTGIFYEYHHTSKKKKIIFMEEL